MLDNSQLKAYTKLIHQGGGVVWHKVGEGKTRIALSWFAHIAKSTHKGNNYFVVVCRREAFRDWQREAEILKLTWRVCDFEVFAGKAHKYPTVLLVSHGVLHKLQNEIAEWGVSISAVVLDEGYKFKNPNSKLCEAANAITEGRPAAILSGSIMTAQNVEDIWGQLKAINRHHVLASTLTQFRSRYMVKYKIGEAFKYSNRKGGYARITRIIRPFTSTHFPASKRKQVNKVIEVEATRSQKRMFARLRREYSLDHKGITREAKNAPSLIALISGISDGFFTNNLSTVSVPTRKLRRLRGVVLPKIARGERVVVWCAFRRTVDAILQYLQPLRCYAMVGGRKFDYEGWQRDGQVAVATEDCGVSFNHFKDCKTAIYYSMSFKWLSLQQSKGRTDRKDSAHDTCRYLFLQTRGSMDSHVYNVVQRSSGAEQELINNLKGWIYGSN